MSENSLIQLGVCHKPHGIKGGFSFILENPDDSILKKGMKVFLFPKEARSSLEDEGECFEIAKISFGNKTIAYLKRDGEEISDRNIVEDLLPFIIKVPREEFPELDEGEIYLSDLLGINVRDLFNDKIIGTVYRTFDNGAQTVVTIKLHSGKLVDIPFVENFIPVVDIENKEIGVHMPHFV